MVDSAVAGEVVAATFVEELLSQQQARLWEFPFYTSPWEVRGNSECSQALFQRPSFQANLLRGNQSLHKPNKLVSCKGSDQMKKISKLFPLMHRKGGLS